MINYLNYIIEANIGLLLFLMFYQLLLRRETDFTLLRIFMLAGIFTSLLFPFIRLENIQGASALSVSHIIPAYWLPELVIDSGIPGEAQQTTFSFWTYTALFYAIGVIFFFVTLLVHLAQLLRLIGHSRTYRIRKLRIAESSEDKATFSFFNFIFIGKAQDLSTEEKQQIIQHEAVHAQQWHSFDILLVNVLRICFWFNPIILTYKRIFVQLHEFEADSRTVENSDVNKYCSLMAKVALKSAGVSLANHFNASLTVKRITMIRSIKNKTSYWKVAACALLIPATFILLSCQDQVAKGSLIANETTFEPDEPATPKGGLDQLYNTIRRNVRYPAESRANHKYGKILLQFAVNEDGRLSDIMVLESPDNALSQEVIRVLQLVDEWVPAKIDGLPVRQELVLPFVFKLDYPGKEKNQQVENSNQANVPSSLREIVVVAYAIQ